MIKARAVAEKYQITESTVEGKQGICKLCLFLTIVSLNILNKNSARF